VKKAEQVLRENFTQIKGEPANPAPLFPGRKGDMALLSTLLIVVFWIKQGQ
jgi:hypothetical protein